MTYTTPVGDSGQCHERFIMQQGLALKIQTPQQGIPKLLQMGNLCGILITKQESVCSLSATLVCGLS